MALRLEVTGWRLADVGELMRSLRGEWHMESFAAVEAKNDRSFLVKGEGVAVPASEELVVFGVAVAGEEEEDEEEMTEERKGELRRMAEYYANFEVGM